LHIFVFLCDTAKQGQSIRLNDTVRNKPLDNAPGQRSRYTVASYRIRPILSLFEL